MSRLRLEEFDVLPIAGTSTPSPLAEAMTEVQSEEAKLESFENGYKAGWDDAARSHTDNLDNVSVELGRNLQELSFTFHEARTQVLKDMRAVFEELFSKILPKVAAETLPAIIAEQINEIVGREVDTRIELRVHPSNQDIVGQFVAAQTHLNVDVVPEPAFGEGQARLVFASGEQNIDLSKILETAAQKTEGFFELNEKAG
ncbi:hypothetical protein [Halocynthiibacter namhaensis]|uniref:FliH/SctL family protein n=1 Tax=Halocynthiibacter namhaensis TaxID=1290553 RepID=UPI0005790A58|nr:hypothetical protein [Halocynthiibacter namhaensis]